MDSGTGIILEASLVSKGQPGLRYLLETTPNPEALKQFCLPFYIHINMEKQILRLGS